MQYVRTAVVAASAVVSGAGKTECFVDFFDLLAMSALDIRPKKFFVSPVYSAFLLPTEYAGRLINAVICHFIRKFKILFRNGESPCVKKNKKGKVAAAHFPFIK